MQLKNFVSLCFLSSKKGHNNAFIASLLWCDNTTYILQRWGRERKTFAVLHKALFWFLPPTQQIVNEVQVLPLITEFKRLQNKRGTRN